MRLRRRRRHFDLLEFGFLFNAVVAVFFDVVRVGELLPALRCHVTAAR